MTRSVEHAIAKRDGTKKRLAEEEDRERVLARELETVTNSVGDSCEGDLLDAALDEALRKHRFSEQKVRAMRAALAQDEAKIGEAYAALASEKDATARKLIRDVLMVRRAAKVEKMEKLLLAFKAEMQDYRAIGAEIFDAAKDLHPVRLTGSLFRPAREHAGALLGYDRQNIAQLVVNTLGNEVMLEAAERRPNSRDMAEAEIRNWAPFVENAGA